MIACDCSPDMPWAAERDPSLAFEAELLQEALEIWCAHAEPGAPPPRSILTARVMKPFLGNAVIAERQGDGRYRMALVGSRISLMAGEMEGHLLDDCLPPAAALHWSAVFDMVLAGLHPSRFVSSVAILDLHFLRAEIMLAPLLDEEGRPAFVLGVATFKSRAHADREALAETGA